MFFFFSNFSLFDTEPGRKLLKIIQDLEVEVRNFLMAVGDLHLKHRSVADDLLNRQDVDLINKAECKRLAGTIEVPSKALHLTISTLEKDFTC